MVNNTSTESSIYLKKSELPTNVSAFKNDADYLSSSTIEDWLGEHSYIPKDEIDILISNANNNVLNQINSSSSNTYDDEINSLQGQVREIKEKLDDIILTGYATEAWVNKQGFLTEHQSLDGYATEKWVENKGYLTKHQSLDDYASKAWINEQGFLTEHQSLSEYATQKWVENKKYLTEHQSLDEYAKKSDIPSLTDYVTSSSLDTKINEVKNSIPSLTGYATQKWVESKGYLTKHQSLDNYATKSWINEQDFLTEHQSLDGYATEKWVENKKYLTKHQSLTGYATESWVMDKGFLTEHQSLDGYATEKWVEDKGFLTEHQSLDGYATEKWVTGKKYVTQSSLSSTLGNYATEVSVKTINDTLGTFLTKTDAKYTYLSLNDANDDYLKIKDAKKEYLAIEDYRGIKEATTISSAYKDKTLEDLQNDIDTLLNGFYIVDLDDVVIVKDHEILSIFEDGTKEPVLKWKEEDE